MLATEQYSDLMQVIGKGDTDKVHIRMGDGGFHVSGPMDTPVIFCKFLGAGFPAGINANDMVAASLSVDGFRVKNFGWALLFSLLLSLLTSMLYKDSRDRDKDS